MYSFLLPTRGRVKQCRLALDNLLEMVTAKHEVIMGWDADDPEREGYESLYEEHAATIARKSIVFDKRTPPGAACQALLGLATGDIIVPFSDDLRIRTLGWEQILERRVPDDGMWAAVMWSGLDWNPTIMAYSRQFIEAIGGLSQPGIEHNYGDTWIADIAAMCFRLIPLPEVYFEHLHWMAGKAQKDEVYAYQERDNHARQSLDRAAFMAGRQERQRIAQRIMDRLTAEARARYASGRLPLD